MSRRIVVRTSPGAGSAPWWEPMDGRQVPAVVCGVCSSYSRLRPVGDHFVCRPCIAALETMTVEEVRALAARRRNQGGDW